MLSQKYGINTRYSEDAIFLPQQTLDSCIERGQNPKKLIFGSRVVFEKLKKKHLTKISTFDRRYQLLAFISWAG